VSKGSRLMRASLLLWDRGAHVLVEELPGLWHRQTADPFDEDGWAPLWLATLANEAYVAQSALTVAYANPRATLPPFSPSDTAIAAGEYTRLRNLSLFLRGITAAVSRRYPQDELDWILIPRESFAAHDTERLQLACWNAGLATVTVAPPWDGSIPLTATRTSSSHPSGCLVLASMNATRPGVRLMIPEGDRWVLVEERKADATVDDPLDIRPPQTPLSHSAWVRNGTLRQHITRQVLCGNAPTLERIPLARGSEWMLEPVEVSCLLRDEERYWQTLARFAKTYLHSLEGSSVAQLLLMESGQSAFLPRFERHGRSVFAAELTLPTLPLRLESCIHDWVATAARPTLAAPYVLRTVGEAGPVCDWKCIASRGTALPFQHRAGLSVPPAGRGAVTLQLCKLDEITHDTYPVATWDVSTTSHPGTEQVLQATVTGHPCGVLEVTLEGTGIDAGQTLLTTASGHYPLTTGLLRDLSVTGVCQ
jgi:hypothetical protein